MTLLEFLEARLAEDEAIARAVEDRSAPWDGQWKSDGPDALRTYNDWVLFHGNGRPLAPGLVDHVARHDPVRVLAEVEAKRDLIDLVLGYEAGIDGEFGCCHKADAIAEGECPENLVDDIEGLRMLAAPYAGHVDYLPEWAVTPGS